MGLRGIVACAATAAALALSGCGGSSETGIQIIVHTDGIDGSDVSEIVLYLGQAVHADGVTAGPPTGADAGVEPDAPEQDAGTGGSDDGSGSGHGGSGSGHGGSGGGGSDANGSDTSGSDGSATGSGSAVTVGSGSNDMFFVPPPLAPGSDDGSPEIITLTTQHSGGPRKVALFKRAHSNTGDVFPYAADKSDYRFLFEPNSESEISPGDTFDVIAAFAMSGTGTHVHPIAVAIHGGVTMVDGQVNTYDLDLVAAADLAAASADGSGGGMGVELWPDNSGSNACARIVQPGVADDLAIVNAKDDPDCDGFTFDGPTPECVADQYDGSAAAVSGAYTCSAMHDEADPNNGTALVCELGNGPCTDGTERACGASTYCLPPSLCGPDCLADPTSQDCLAATPTATRLTCAFFGVPMSIPGAGADPLKMCEQVAALPTSNSGTADTRVLLNPQFLAGQGAPSSSITITADGAVGTIAFTQALSGNAIANIGMTGLGQFQTPTTVLVLANVGTAGRGIALPLDITYTKADQCSSETVPQCAFAGDAASSDAAVQLSKCLATRPPEGGSGD